MKDERRIKILGQIKRKFSYYVIVIAALFFILKLILNSSAIIIDALPEFVLIVGLLITNAKPSQFKADKINRVKSRVYSPFPDRRGANKIPGSIELLFPMEKVETMPDFHEKFGKRIEEEKANRNLNDYYNKSFKILLPIVLFSYILSVILLFKTNAEVLITPNLFLNTILFLMFIGFIYLVRKHRIYLNEHFLKEGNYFTSVFKIIGYIFIGSVFLFTLTFLLNIIIPGKSISNLVFTLIFVSSFLNLSIQYFLYSIFEYYRYKKRMR